jgi:uncharacterized protein (DUF2164 family)
MRGKAPIELPDEARKRAVASLRRYLDENMEEEVGELKTGLLLDFVLEEIGPTIYNEAIADARAFFEERAADLAAIGYRVEFPHSTRRG